tara:strand:+ start:1801 stop:2046 length:246 start_codon:yes stop_codon:yes gene_type:complete
MEKQKDFTTMDIYLSAFLSQFGIQPELKLKNGKVIFSFPHDDDLYKLLMNYNCNVNVPVADFVTTIKTLRGQMLTMRGASR